MKYLTLLLLIGFGLGQVYDPETGMLLSENPCENERYLKLDRQFSNDSYEFWSDSEREEWKILSRKCREFSSEQGSDNDNQNYLVIDGVKYIKEKSINLTEPNDICDQAMLDANKFESPLWYLGGIMYYFGVPAYLVSKPKPNQYVLSNIINEDQLVYQKCYNDAAKNVRAKRMLLGCAGLIPVYLLMLSIGM